MKIRPAIAATVFAFLPTIAAGHESVAEFTPGESEKLDWRVVDDGVMGGLSQGKREIGKDGVLRFFGTLSLENNGGFSSLRTGDVKMDLSGAEGVVLRVKGDGRTYQLRFSTDAEYRGREMSFQAGFPTSMGEWIEVKVPFKRFLGTWRGIELPDKVFNPAKIRRIGLQLADKKAGPFELHVDWIRTYGGDNTPASGAH
jgi:monofunctional biosynthetic peptidoglycan transglycosylase